MANNASFKSIGAATDALEQTYNASSGCDIIATIDGIAIGNLNGISFSTTREKAPIYVMGSTDAVSFGRGKRGHAGSLIFTNFDRHALYDIMEGTAMSTTDKYRYYYWKKTQDVPAGGRSLMLGNRDVVNDFTSLLGQELAQCNYSDQLPPFTVTLTAMNEYGNRSVLHILGVELINEGSGISIDDIVTETQMTFVARSILGWRPLGRLPKSNAAIGQSYAIGSTNILERLNTLTAVKQAELTASLPNV
jgi:hypothetical protein